MASAEGSDFKPQLTTTRSRNASGFTPAKERTSNSPKELTKPWYPVADVDGDCRCTSGTSLQAPSTRPGDFIWVPRFGSDRLWLHVPAGLVRGSPPLGNGVPIQARQERTGESRSFFRRSADLPREHAAEEIGFPLRKCGIPATTQKYAVYHRLARTLRRSTPLYRESVRRQSSHSAASCLESTRWQQTPRVQPSSNERCRISIATAPPGRSEEGAVNRAPRQPPRAFPDRNAGDRNPCAASRPLGNARLTASAARPPYRPSPSRRPVRTGPVPPKPRFRCVPQGSGSAAPPRHHKRLKTCLQGGGRGVHA